MCTCRICGWTGEASALMVREMQFEMAEEFGYFECGSCHCLQLKEIPENLGRYYGQNYFSFNEPKCDKETALVEGENIRVLDVGCGAGEFLCKMARGGYASLTGCDPFIEKDIVYENGVHIYKREIHEMEGEYDWIFFNDSFEHVTDPHEVLDSAKRLLAPKGVLRIKIPVYPNIAFDMFGADWFQIDAPRHIFLHSKQSMNYLADKHGLAVVKREYDAGLNQIVHSYLYSQNISFWKHTREAIYRYFTDADLDDLEESCKIANENEYGDHAVFYLIQK